jgi:preprotein translocase subunit SecG
METFLKFLHVAVCLFLIVTVLLQAGKGGGVGIAFGGGGSQTVFGSSGAGNFLTKLTSVTAFLFLLTSLGLSHYSSQQDSSRLQRLAERKAVEKKADDARAAKLAADLDKARQSANQTTKKPGDAPASPDLSTAPLATPLKLQMPGEKPAPSDSADKPVLKATAPAKPNKLTNKLTKKKRRTAPAAPGAEGDTKGAPAEAPAAPAAPAP